MNSTFLFLGTGASCGVPMIGCHCAVCSSQNPHNKRLRPAGLLTIGEKRILIDVGPDFRIQALLHHLDQLDGVIITHAHFDHIAGLDELRTYYLLHRQVFPLLASEATYLDLKKRYDYLFHPKTWGLSLAAQLDFQVLKGERGHTKFLDIPIQYMTYEQGGMKVSGFRFGTFAYISDIRNYPETIFEDLSGVKTLVVSSLRKEPSLMHFGFEEAISFAKKVGAQRIYLTHISHETDHAEGHTSLPPEVSLAYDGLKIGLVLSDG